MRYGLLQIATGIKKCDDYYKLRQYSMYTGVGVNIVREMVLSPNDEEVANVSKKTYPIQD